MLQPASVMAYEFPLPSSPPPADAVLDSGHNERKKYPDLRNIGFSCLDDSNDEKYPNLLPEEVPLPPGSYFTWEKLMRRNTQIYQTLGFFFWMTMLKHNIPNCCLRKFYYLQALLVIQSGMRRSTPTWQTQGFLFWTIKVWCVWWPPHGWQRSLCLRVLKIHTQQRGNTLIYPL